MEKMDREPCPFRIVEDAGGAFTFGLIGGTVWHTFGGIRNAPSGQRAAQAISRVRARVPMLGGSFAVWGTLFSCCDCTFTYFRKKEDPWNAIMSGAATGGILAARAGLKAAGKSALVGGVILAAIEGLNLVLMRVIMPQFEKQQEVGYEIDQLLPPPDPSRPRSRLGLAPKHTPNSSTSLDGNNTNLKGFDLDAILANKPTGDNNQWDTPGYTSDSSSEEESPPPKKPFYQFW